MLCVDHFTMTLFLSVHDQATFKKNPNPSHASRAGPSLISYHRHDLSLTNVLTEAARDGTHSRPRFQSVTIIFMTSYRFSCCR